MKLLLISAITIFFTIFFYSIPLHVFAQENWVINNYSAVIAIEESGEVGIAEKIVVDFGSLEKHGIYRTIPVVYERDGERTFTKIKVNEITQDGDRVEYKVLGGNEDTVKIRIGDPDKTISGKHTYMISYTTLGILRGFQTYDELYWNVIGPYWEVPIEKASAEVRLKKPGIEQVKCFEGELGITYECQTEVISNTFARFETKNLLDPYEGFTVVVGYKKDLFPLIIVERPKTFFEKFVEWPSLITLFSVLTFGVGTVLYLWFRGGRDYWNKQQFVSDAMHKGEIKPIGAHETVVVEYTPPEKLPPAVLGVLVDERAHTHDVTATIIDLATRGYLTIDEIPKKWMFGKVDYELVKKKYDFKELLTYEKLLLQELFDSGGKVKVSNLKKTFYDSLKKVKDALYDEVSKRNLFSTNPEKVRSRYLLIGFFVMILGAGLFAFSISNDLIFLSDIGVGGVISGIVLLIFSQFMPRRSAYGRELFRRVRGYELFIGNVEQHRQKFFEKQNMFNEVLPYAIVFGITKKFADAMEEMGVKPSQMTTSWYHGTTPLKAGLLASHISDFSSSFGTAIASTPSGSGFSSGGSSGGGFGGGGGGSW